MFGHASSPSRIYRYGVRPPVENAAEVDRQMRQAHRYRNALVHHELIRRRKVDRALTILSPALAAVEAEIPVLEAEGEAARTAVKDAHIQARERSRPALLTQAVKDVRAKLKDAYARRKALRADLFKSLEWEKVNGEIEAWAKRYTHRLRASCGLYWGSYLHVEQSMSDRRKGAPPRFRRWEGDGHIAVQIQKGMSPAAAFAGEDTRLRIEPVPPEAWLPGGRRLRRTRVHVRVGSDPKGGAIFAVFPMVLHRPIPEDASIKWVHIVRRRIATHCEWSAQFVLAREAGWVKPGCATDGCVGVDVGWRKRPDGSLRVAYWMDDQGREGELALPSDWLEQMQKVRDIQSIRDKLRDEILPVLRDGLKSFPTLPAPLAQAFPFLHALRSQARLSRLVDVWRTTCRFEGDGELFSKAEAWRKRDKHLYEYEGNLRDQLQRRRLDLYRVFAAHLRRTYSTVAVECLDLRDFHELPDVDQPMPSEVVKRYVRDACLSALLGAIKDCGATVEKLPAPYTTLIHATCGNVEVFDRTRLYNVCSHCGESYDQDRNAAINLLRGSSASVVQAT